MKSRVPRLNFLLAIAVLALAGQPFLPGSRAGAGSSPPAAHAYSVGGDIIEDAFDPTSYYRLTTKWQGDKKSLDILNDGKNNNQPILAVTGDYSGQYWKITPAGNGYYRLTTEWQGPGKSLDIVNDGKNNNRIILSKTGKYTGQNWKITPLGDGYYRLTTEWQGTGKSLDIVNDGKDNNQPILADTGNYTGQFWKITKVK